MQVASSLEELRHNFKKKFCQPSLELDEPTALLSSALCSHTGAFIELYTLPVSNFALVSEGSGERQWHGVRLTAAEISTQHPSAQYGCWWFWEVSISHIVWDSFDRKRLCLGCKLGKKNNYSPSMQTNGYKHWRQQKTTSSELSYRGIFSQTIITIFSIGSLFQLRVKWVEPRKF